MEGLFDQQTEPERTPPHKLARKNDPKTSKLAAAQIAPKASDRERWAARCVAAKPGHTGAELDLIYHAKNRQLSKRLSGAAEKKLVKRGEARQCKVGGNSAITWWPEGEWIG